MILAQLYKSSYTLVHHQFSWLVMMIMANNDDEQQQISNLAAARDVLRSCLAKSRDIDIALQDSCKNVDITKKRLGLLKDSFQDVAWQCKVYNVGGSLVDHAIGPAASVLRIFLVIQDLQSALVTHSLSDDHLRLREYLANVQRMEDAVRLLKDNSELLMLWLQDALQKLLNVSDKEHAPWYVLILKKAMKILEQMQQGIEQESCFGLMEAFNQLENEFRRILTDFSFPPISFSSPVDDDQIRDMAMALVQWQSPLFPTSDINKLQAIMERFAANNCLQIQRCAAIYVEVRSSNVRAALQGLDVHYLHLSLSESDSVQILECYIDQWETHLRFTVKYLLEIEYRLCHEVFSNDLGMECFADIVFQSGFYDFIKFGNAITRGKKEAIKLLKLLVIFAALNKLRPDFNRLFSRRCCEDVQTQTRELIKRVINGSCEIFWDLSAQVESQRQSAPPLDGRVPRLVRFVTDFCSVLLEDEYRTTLLQVLEIHCSWNDVEFDEGFLSSQIQTIMRALELNVQAWSEVYEEDPLLSYFFRMNNYCYLCDNIKAKKQLRDLVGNEWLMAYKEEMEHYLAIYLKESWEKLPALLNEDGLVLFPGGRALDQELARKRLNEFNSAFEEMYAKQIYWVLSDKGLRLRTRQLIMQAIIPCHNNYVEKYMPHCEDEDEDEDDITNKNKCVKYSSASLQDMIKFLFQNKLGKYGSTRRCISAVS